MSLRPTWATEASLCYSVSICLKHKANKNIKRHMRRINWSTGTVEESLKDFRKVGLERWPSGQEHLLSAHALCMCAFDLVCRCSLLLWDLLDDGTQCSSILSMLATVAGPWVCYHVPLLLNLNSSPNSYSFSIYTNLYFGENILRKRPWWCLIVILAWSHVLGNMRQEEYEFEAVFNYIGKS